MFRKCWPKEDCNCCGRRIGSEPALPLSNAKSGQRCKVASIEGGRGVCGRMAAMGIYPGVEMEVLCGGCDAPCLVRVHGSTLSLGHGVSNKILVTSSP
jgi:ferrous iron transport protein A